MVVDLDESGEYDEAVALATTTAADGPTAALDAFDRASQDVVSRAAADATDGLRSGNSIFLVLAVLTLLARARRRRSRHLGHRPAP